MVYYGVSWYESPESVLVVRMQSKDAVIAWMETYGFNPDHNFLVRSMREVKDTLRDYLPNYRFKRSDSRLMFPDGKGGYNLLDSGSWV